LKAIEHCRSTNKNPIILHSDSIDKRDQLCEKYSLLSLPLNPVHTMMKTNNEEYIKTISEFYFMGLAEDICSVVVNKNYGGDYTGFSYWCSKLHDKPLYKF
jgi:hypothetical protein